MLALLLAAAAAPVPAAAPPVFTKDVAPIFYKHCAVCHHEGEVAPFPLITYQDAKKRARLIADVTRSRQMPPWKPVPGYNDFAGDRRLSDRDLQIIQRWVATGAREGDPAKLPPAPQFPDGWKLGKPDLIVQPSQPFEVPAEGLDVYECFIVPMNLPRDQFIRAVEFRPSNRRIVHHSLMFADARHIRASQDIPASEPGVIPDPRNRWLVSWDGPVKLPEGAAAAASGGSKLAVQVHYHPDGKPEEDQWRVGIYFTDKAPVRRVVDVGLASNADRYPGGRPALCGPAHFTTPIAVDAVGIIPHAHLLCREMRGWAILPTAANSGC